MEGDCANPNISGHSPINSAIQPTGQVFGGKGVANDNFLDVMLKQYALFDFPLTTHHHVIGALGSAQDQRCNGIAITGKPWLIQAK